MEIEVLDVSKLSDEEVNLKTQDKYIKGFELLGSFGKNNFKLMFGREAQED